MSIFRFAFRKIFPVTIVSLFVGLGTGLAYADPQYAVSGSAYRLGKNELLYREFYTPLDANNEVQVSYTRPDGEVFATKTLRYTANPTQPEFDYHDLRDNERLAGRFSAGRLILTYDQEGYKQEKELVETLGLVTDNGFDVFIQQHWDQLVAGEKIRFTYALPYQLNVANLQVRQITADKSPLFDADSPATWRYFIIERANRFASIFKAPIHLAYESEGKYLMRYAGHSPLDDDNKGIWEVRVDYEYWQ
jgi:hypothetical protein